jgi:hypothetical protein
MKRLSLIVIIASGSILAVRPAEFQVTNVSVNGGQVLLSWANGRPNYQVQSRPSLNHDWTNIGQPTTNMSVGVALSGDAAFYRVVTDYTAQYEVTFDATWSPTTHPVDFPAGAHWSGLVGGVHNGNARFFHAGEMASEGIRLMAERGRQPQLLAEVDANITNGAAQFQLSGGGISSSPGARQLTFPQTMRRDFPLVTLCSMIAPSPDWFVGVDSLSLIENGQWLTNKVVTLGLYDAGTDSGSNFTSPDEVTAPRGVVTPITGYPALVDGQLVPFGTFTFRRLD